MPGQMEGYMSIRSAIDASASGGGGSFQLSDSVKQSSNEMTWKQDLLQHLQNMQAGELSSHLP